MEASDPVNMRGVGAHLSHVKIDLSDISKRSAAPMHTKRGLPNHVAREIVALDVNSVQPRRAGQAPPGTRGVDAAAASA
jgi:hypothetical protein